MKKIFILVFLLVAVPALARHHKHPRINTRLFKPSVDAAEAQTRVIDEFGWERIRNDKELQGLIRAGKLVSLRPAPGLRIDPRLPENRRYVRPWTQGVIDELASLYVARFDSPLIVTSAVRPATVQRRLLRWNRNAAPIHGEHASSHMTGATVDISRRSMTLEQTRFVEDTLLDFAIRNRVVVLEERGQMCFHIFTIPERSIVVDWR